MTKNFKTAEFACPCCGEVKTSNHLMAALEFVRCYFDDRIVTITSGYRCPEHNADPKVGGATSSKHLLGIAADIEVKGVNPEDVYDLLNMTFPRSYGIGLYDWGVHVDVREDRARW